MGELLGEDRSAGGVRRAGRTSSLRRGWRHAGIGHAAALAISLLCGEVAAAEDPPPIAASSGGSASGGVPGAWELLLGAWMPRFEGTLSWGGGSEFESGDLGLDDLEATFAGDLSWRNEWLRLGVSGFSFSSRGGATLPAGAAIGSLAPLAAATSATAAVDLWSVAAQASFTLYRPFASPRTPWAASGGIGAAAQPVDLAFEAIGAVRYLSLSQSVSPQGLATQSFDHAALGLGVGGGLRFRWEPQDRFAGFEALSIYANAAGGPAIFSDGGWFVQLEAGLEWWFCSFGSVQLGYRLLDFRIASGGDLSNAGLQGIFAGVRIAF